MSTSAGPPETGPSHGSAKRTTPRPWVSATLLSVLTLVAWVVYVNHPQQAAASSGTAAVVATPSPRTDIATLASSTDARRVVGYVAHCAPGTAHLVALLEMGMGDTRAWDLQDVSVVRSRAFASIYFIAAASGTGWEAKVGLWATTDPNGGTVLYSVNEIARTASEWPDARTLDARVTDLADGADVATACADG